jgi:macrodomain Ter protein organizer (MatP/YcbG family)
VQYLRAIDEAYLMDIMKQLIPVRQRRYDNAEHKEISARKAGVAWQYRIKTVIFTNTQKEERS